jgi:hypothetical protein
MFTWRNALILGAIFITVGIIYFFVQGPDNGTTSDRAGVTMLILLGGAMAFVFTIILRGSREL